MTFSGFWFKCPDELDTLLALPPAQLKVFLVVMRAQERDRNAGKLSVRRIAGKLDTKCFGYVSEVLKALCDRGLLEAEGGIVWGRTTTYRVPVRFRGGDNCSTTAEQSDRKDGSNCSSTAEQLGADKAPNCSPNYSTAAEQNCSSTAEQHSSSESREGKESDDSSLNADDDENLPPVERLTRWIQQRHPEANAAEVVGFIRSDLAERNLEVPPAFVQFIRENATGKSHNPVGLYRDLVKRFITTLRVAGAEQRLAVRQAVTTGIQSDGFDGAAKYPCCKGTGKRADGAACDCACGDFYRQLEQHRSKASNGAAVRSAAGVMAEVDVPECSGETAADAENAADQSGKGAKCSDSSGGSSGPSARVSRSSGRRGGLTVVSARSTKPSTRRGANGKGPGVA